MALFLTPASFPVRLDVDAMGGSCAVTRRGAVRFATPLKIAWRVCDSGADGCGAIGSRERIVELEEPYFPARTKVLPTKVQRRVVRKVTSPKHAMADFHGCVFQHRRTPMTIRKLDDLFLTELHETYAAEKLIVAPLSKLAITEVEPSADYVARTPHRIERLKSDFSVARDAARYRQVTANGGHARRSRPS